MRYFAYGSNLSTPRLRRRIGAVQLVGVGSVSGRRLVFHKRSQDGSAKCDVPAQADGAGLVWGAVFELNGSDKSRLDWTEGFRQGYEQEEVELCLRSGETVAAFAYVATDIDPALKPFDWYREHVLRGAREHGLPAEYVARIEEVEFSVDPDEERRNRELSVYTKPSSS